MYKIRVNWGPFELIHFHYTHSQKAMFGWHTQLILWTIQNTTISIALLYIKQHDQHEYKLWKMWIFMMCHALHYTRLQHCNVKLKLQKCFKAELHYNRTDQLFYVTFFMSNNSKIFNSIGITKVLGNQTKIFYLPRNSEKCVNIEK